MKVRIVCYCDPHAWIVGKFALKLESCLKSEGIDAEIVRTPDPTADINHHLIFVDWDGQPSGIDTVMVTHVDSSDKLNMLSGQLKTSRMGICMSSETMERLVVAGLPRDRLTFVNPAHDEVFRPRKIVVGITSKTQSDGRKKEGELLRICAGVSPEYIRFRIMGYGWESQVESMRAMGFEVEYTPRFEMDKYRELIPTLDYYLYFSWDEGSMGFLDAVAAGVKTIVTPQGFHLDAHGGLTHSASSSEDIVKVLDDACREIIQRQNAVSQWTWRNYALKHIGIWRYLLGEADSLPDPFFGEPPAGLQYSGDRFEKKTILKELKKNRLKYFVHFWSRRIKKRLLFQDTSESNLQDKPVAD